MTGGFRKLVIGFNCMVLSFLVFFSSFGTAGGLGLKLLFNKLIFKRVGVLIKIVFSLIIGSGAGDTKIVGD